MIKRIVAMLLCVAMLTSMLPVQTRAEDSQMLPLPVAAETTAPEETAEETATTEAAEPTQTTPPSADETEGTEPDSTESVLETETAAQESIHEHVYEALVTEPTCTEAGYTTYTCICGDSYVADYEDPIVAYKCLEVQMERGSVTFTYDLGYSSSHYKNYVRTAYDIRTGGADRVSIEKFAAAHGTVYIQFFSADYTKVSSTAYTDEAVVDIPEGCDFIRVEIQTTEDLEKIAIRFYEGTGEPREAKRAAKNELSEKLTYKVSDEIHTTSRLMLPPNYSTDGEKVPLILWLEGSGSSLSTWDGDFNSNKLPYLQYLRDEGFAVFSVYAWGNEYAEKYPGCGKSFPYPIPINLACIKAGIEYICDRYNIDADDIHIMSKSQGGQCALYYASRNELNVKTIGMFAPVLDYLSMPGEALYKDTRAAIADELDFTGDVAYFASDRFLSYSDEGRAFLRQNLDKLFTMNEAWTNLSGATPEELFESSMDDCETFWTEQIWKTNRTDIYTHAEYVKTASVPVKIWGAQDDAATPYMKMVEVVQQLKNGGAVADLRTLPNGTGAHSCADIGSTRVDVTTALGIEHANVPIGWVENIQWIRSGGVSEEIHSHSYESTVTPPTCTEQGYTTYTCDCGDSYIADYVDATGHTYSNGTCTGCGADDPKPYAGKTIACIGDSITYGVGVTRDENDYVTVLAKDLEMDYIRLGVSGTTLCTDGSRTCNIGKLTESNLQGADLVTIAMGINDFCAAGEGYYELGDIQSTDSSTIYGAVRMWCEQITELQKTDSLSDTQFCFVTPLITSWNNSVTSARNWDQSKTNIHGYTLRDLCNAIIEVCDLYEIPVIDLNLVSGLYYNSAEDNNIDKFGGDGVHPGEIGHQMMAKAIGNALLKNNLRDDHDHTYGSWITTTYPDCEAGEQQRVCSVCTATERKALEGKGHGYENGTCTGCGADHPELADYSGKVISVMGDSISTFAGYIPTADGFNLEHLARYPQDNLLTDVNETWWMQVIHALDAKLGINDSWRGATLSGGAPVTSGTTGENAAMSNLTRIRNLGANGTPDMILLYGGTNDLAHVSKVGSFDKNTAPTVVDLTTAKWDNLADGFVHTLLRMRHFYPDAKIVALLPAPTTSYYADAKLNEGNQVMIQICDHYGIPYVDLRSCGITTADLPDGIHPDETGMDFISAAVVDVVLENCDLAAGENKVYAVSHQLTNATAQKHYYKGVSAGLVFEETLAGDNLQVTVTMGGADITAEVYKNGKITIPKVTGDLVITAKARFSLGARLQPLPEKICGSTNLWPLLKHDTDYYTGTKWAAHATGVVRSATIPVEPGQRLWATSFGAAKANGGSINGIRLTWFGEDGVLESVGADAVYAEFAAKGYVEVPEGANAANVVMWNDKTGNELYILDLSHIYEEGRCIGCGNSLLKGDVDLDGDVDAADLTRLTRHMAEIETISDPAALKNADVTGDGQIRPDDQTKLARYIGKIISSLD